MQNRIDNTRYQAAQESLVIASKGTETLADDNKAIETINLHALNNPLGEIRKAPVDFAQWLNRFGKKQFVADESLNRPFFEREYIIRCKKI